MKIKTVFGVIIATTLVSSTLTYHITSHLFQSDQHGVTREPINISATNEITRHAGDCSSRDSEDSAIITKYVDSNAVTINSNINTSASTNTEDSRVSESQIREIFLRQQQQLETFTKSVAQHDSPMQLVQEHYNNEPVNYDWALRKEEAILSLFDNHESLNSFSPLDLSCKSKNCRLVLAAENQEQAKVIYRSFLQAVTENDHEDSMQSVTYFTDRSNGQLVVYVSEGGTKDLL